MTDAPPLTKQDANKGLSTAALARLNALTSCDVSPSQSAQAD